MQIEKLPYEFLVRWDRDGGLAGAHAQFRYVTRDVDGNVLGEFVGAAEPVAMAQAAGFPLEQILGHALTAAMITIDRRTDPAP